MNDDIYEEMHQLEQYNGELLQRHQADKEKIQRLQKQLEIAMQAISAVLHDEFIKEHADAGLVMYVTTAENKIKELEK